MEAIKSAMAIAAFFVSHYMSNHSFAVMRRALRVGILLPLAAGAIRYVILCTYGQRSCPFFVEPFRVPTQHEVRDEIPD